jgi:hypothetical protein
MTFYQFFKEKEADKLGKERVWVCRAWPVCSAGPTS